MSHALPIDRHAALDRMVYLTDDAIASARHLGVVATAESGGCVVHAGAHRRTAGAPPASRGSPGG